MTNEIVTTTHVCLQCGGSGKIFLRPHKKRVPFFTCDLCDGSGQCEDAKYLWIIQGEQIKEWRAKNDLTLREAARRYNIDASNLSKMERGVIRPDPGYLRMTTNHNP